MITGEKLSVAERLITAACFFIPIVGASFVRESGQGIVKFIGKHWDEAMQFASKYIDEGITLISKHGGDFLMNIAKKGDELSTVLKRAFNYGNEIEVVGVGTLKVEPEASTKIQDFVSKIVSKVNNASSGTVKGLSKAEINTCDSIKKIINGKGYSVDEFAQLLDPDRILSDSERLLVDSIRKEIGIPSADTLMCKTIPQSDVYKYLYNQYDGVRGFTAVKEHGNNLTTLLDKYNGARLDYNNTAFKTTNGVDGISQSVGMPDKFYATIEYKANDVSKISIPDWAPKLDDYPYTGKGFTGSVDVVLPEYFQETRKFMDGDIFNIIDSDTGEIIQQFIYDMDTDIKWVMIGGK